MPVITDTPAVLAIGDYYVNRRTGMLVEIMQVDVAGNCMVLDVRADLDAPWTLITRAQMASALWQRVRA
jgi:hypothetical protein